MEEVVRKGSKNECVGDDGEDFMISKYKPSRRAKVEDGIFHGTKSPNIRVAGSAIAHIMSSIITPCII